MSRIKFFISTILFIVLSVSIGTSGERGIRVRENRLALVIGNADYKTSPLKNPVNDARDISGILEKLDFDVIYRENASQREFEEAIREFGNRLRQMGGIGLFYYAGHGVQVRDDNFLIPVDAQIYQETDIKYEAIHAGRILDAMYNASNRMNIVILDACRDNPFARSFRSTAQGLARMNAPTGTLIAYATSPGNVAADGDGRNSFYTKHLLRQMPDPSLSIEKVFKNVRVGVITETNKRQVPWESSSLTGDFYFNSPKRTPPDISSRPPTPSEPPPASDINEYDAIIRERKKIKEKWAAWQAQLERQFAKVEGYDSSTELTSQEKIDAWDTFLASYGTNNPYSSADDELRKTALSKKAYWRSRLSEPGKVVETSDRNQPPLNPLKAATPVAAIKKVTPAEPAKSVKPAKHAVTAIDEKGVVNRNIKKIIILPFKDVSVGKGKDVDIDVVAGLIQGYDNITIGSSYYRSDSIRLKNIDKLIKPGDIKKIWSYDIHSNVESISEVSKKFAADIVLIYKKRKRKVKIPFQETQSNDPNMQYKKIQTLSVYIVDVENKKAYTASKDFSVGLFFNTDPIVTSITANALDQYIAAVADETESGTFSSEK